MRRGKGSLEELLLQNQKPANLVLSIQQFMSQTVILELLILSECGLRLYDWMTQCNNTAGDSMSESGPGSGGGGC